MVGQITEMVENYVLRFFGNFLSLKGSIFYIFLDNPTGVFVLSRENFKLICIVGEKNSVDFKNKLLQNHIFGLYLLDSLIHFVL